MREAWNPAASATAAGRNCPTHIARRHADRRPRGPHHRHRLGARRTHGDHDRAQPVADAMCDIRRAAAADDDAQSRRAGGMCGRQVVGREDLIAIGHRHRAQRGEAVDGQADMDRPLGRPAGIFASAVQRIDDPDAAGRTTSAIVDRLLRQDEIVGRAARSRSRISVFASRSPMHPGPCPPARSRRGWT